MHILEALPATHNFEKKKYPGKSMTEIQLHHRTRDPEYLSKGASRGQIVHYQHTQSRNTVNIRPDHLSQDLGLFPKPGVHLPSVQYANIHTEQRYFTAYLHKYGCLSQDSTLCS